MSYVTNPIANRLGIQQGWNNPLISLGSGLTNISFITYLKCYLLMQEYLRHNQMNLVFFEIKPLHKNKKLIDLFVYKNILHLMKNELTFYSRKELTKKGFLQLAFYLHQKKIKRHQFKSKRNYQIRYVDSWKKDELANQSAQLQSILKYNFSLKKPFKKLKLKNGLKKSKLKIRLKKLRSKNLAKLSVKNFIRKLKNMGKLMQFGSPTKYRPDRRKNTTYYKQKRLLWKITKYHFLNNQKLKRKYNKKKKKKWWLKKRKNKRSRLSLKVEASKKRKWQQHKYTKKKKKFSRFKSKIARAPKLSALSTKLLSLNKALLLKQRSVHNARFFANFLQKQWFDVIFRKLKRKKINAKSKPKWWLVKQNEKKKRKKKKKYLWKQNDNYTEFLQIKKWIYLKESYRDSVTLSKMRRHLKVFKKIHYASWKYHFFQSLLPKLVPARFHIGFGPKVLRKWLWKSFERSKTVNPLQKFFFLKSHIIPKLKRKRNLKLHRFQFNKRFSKAGKLKLVWKNRAMYDLKRKSRVTVNPGVNALAFARYAGFVNTYQNQQKFSKLNYIKFLSIKPKASLILKKSIFHFQDFNSKFQKLNIALQYFIGKYIQKYLKFPVWVKIKNVSDFIDVRSNQKNINYTKQVFLKPLAGKSFFIRLLHALLNIERVFNPQLFVDLLAAEMQHTKDYRKLAKNMILMFSVLHSEHIMGYKVLIDGKLGGSKQKSTKQIFKLQNKEKIPIQTFTKKVSYALGVARTPAGLFGIRMWLYY